MRSPTSPIHSASRASLAILTALLVPAVIAACSGGATPSPATSSPVASPSPTPVATGSLTVSPTLAPTASPTATVAPSPTACVTGVAAGVAPTDRLTGVKVEAGIGVDTITFTFGKTSGLPFGAAPTGEVRPTAPPFSFGGSGLPFDVEGQRFVAITFRNMAVADEQGNPTYAGPDDLHPNAPAVRELRLAEAFEGVLTWVVGMNGPGCVAVTHLTGPDRIVVSVAQL